MSLPVINVRATQQEYEEVLKLYALRRMVRGTTLAWLQVRCLMTLANAHLLLNQLDNHITGLTAEQISEACAS